MRFEDAFEEFKIYAYNRHKKQGFITLISNFKSNILPYFKNKNIEDLTPIDIIDWQNSIYKLNYKYSYTSKLYIQFKSFIDFCCNYYGLSENVVSKVDNFNRTIDERKFDFYTLDEFNLFIINVEDNIYKQFFNLMFYCGTRPGEAMALRFSDLEGDYLHIRHNLTTKGGRTLESPKNQSSIRTIVIDSKLKHDLLDLKRYYIKIYNDECYDYFIFGGVKPLAPTTIRRKRRIACSKANLREITLHQFRHSHATFLLQKGIMINEVSRRLGHNDVSTTLDIYTHTNLEQEKRVLNTLNSSRHNIFITLISNFKNIIHLLKH